MSDITPETPEEWGRVGGTRTKEKYGIEFYRTISHMAKEAREAKKAEQAKT
jgi:hypothetical protein